MSNYKVVSVSDIPKDSRGRPETPEIKVALKLEPGMALVIECPNRKSANSKSASLHNRIKNMNYNLKVTMRGNTIYLVRLED